MLKESKPLAGSVYKGNMVVLALVDVRVSDNVLSSSVVERRIHCA